MYLIYIDESGDTGMNNSPTKYFILSGLVIHETNWRTTLENLVEFRKDLRDYKGLKIRDEIHAVNFINKPGDLMRIKRNDRLDILKKCLDWLNNQENLKIITIVVNKQNKNFDNDIFEYAWSEFIKNFENNIKLKNFYYTNNQDEKGLILPDNTDGEKLTQIVRKMRHNKTIKLELVIEDPFMKDSKNSLLHQMVDVVAYAAKQLYEPNAYINKKGNGNFYQRLSNVVLKQTGSENSLGIIEI